MVAVAEPRLRALRSALGRGRRAGGVRRHGRAGHNPARIIPAWRDFTDQHSGAGRPVRGIGEPIWATRRPEEIVEAQLHEALLNMAVPPDVPLWLLCPYDTAALDSRSSPRRTAATRSSSSPTTTGAAPVRRRRPRRRDLRRAAARAGRPATGHRLRPGSAPAHRQHHPVGRHRGTARRPGGETRRRDRRDRRRPRDGDTGRRPDPALARTGRPGLRGHRPGHRRRPDDRPDRLQRPAPPGTARSGLANELCDLVQIRSSRGRHHHPPAYPAGSNLVVIDGAGGTADLGGQRFREPGVPRRGHRSNGSKRLIGHTRQTTRWPTGCDSVPSRKRV